jgi:hypothetical protein
VCYIFTGSMHKTVCTFVNNVPSSFRKPEGKRPLGRVGRRWEDNIRMVFREIGSGTVDRIHLPENRNKWRAVVIAVMNLGVA